MKAKYHSKEEVLEQALQLEEKALSVLEKEDFEIYQFLLARFQGGDILNDSVFQFVFRSFYRLDNAGLTSNFKRKYFELLQSHRNDTEIDIAEICRQLYHYPTQQNKLSLQFSFATKLANTINLNYPIYDSKVAIVFGFRTPQPSKEFERRLSQFLAFYDELKRVTAWLEIQPEIYHIFQRMDHQFGKTSLQTHSRKKLDFLLWSVGRVIDSGPNKD